MDTIAIPPKEAAFEIIFHALKECSYDGPSAHAIAILLVDTIIGTEINNILNTKEYVIDIVYALTKYKDYLISKSQYDKA